MKQLVIIEKLKEQINGKKVIAGVFYTFNFEVTFFENYLLPMFLPNVPFSDNEIQNKILWRQYAGKLPPVTVYCDFHAKGPDAPSLDYKVITIDIKTNKGKKPCFHPKISFILLEDWSMIVLIGSCNLTKGGWCTNKEVVSIIKLENRINLPHDYKFNLKKFFEAVFDLPDQEEYSKAEKKVHEFLKSSLYTDEKETQIDFYNPFAIHFTKKMNQLWSLNEGEPFEHVEIISPYITQGESIIRETFKYVEKGNLLLTTPYCEINTADISENNYKKFEEIGITWAKFIEPGKEKGFRFNHSKIYRFKGNKYMHTILGSVNFTEAAWNGVKNKGNVESAVIYTESAENWKPWLTLDSNPDIEFSDNQGDETASDSRKDAPNISFILDWYNNTLSYHLKETGEVSGKVLLDGDTGTILQKGKVTINLTSEWLEILSLNSTIRIRYNGEIFYFYPEQIGIESRPLSIQLKITDQELLNLWKNISIKDEKKSQISDLIEAYIREKTDKEGDLIEVESNTKRTLNLMASHISALINLEEIIFNPPSLVRDYDAAKELFNYYLYTHNVDTLKGYREMLLAMYKDGDLLPGFYWLLLEIIKKDFYNIKDNNAFLKSIRGDMSGPKSAHNSTIKNIEDEIEIVKTDLKGLKNFDNKIIKWITTELTKKNVS